MSFTPSVAVDTIKRPIMSKSSGKTLYVGGSGEGNYTKIQDAINDTINGDMVFVYNGTYYEVLIIDKSISLIGEDRNTTVIDGNYSMDTISIRANYVNINGFTIIHSNFSSIDLFNQTGCTIANNIIKLNNLISILLYGYSNKIIGNIISNNEDCICIFGSNNNITRNIIMNNNDLGIALSKPSNNNIVSCNNIFSNNLSGIVLYYSNNNTISNNIITSNNRRGIALDESNNNTLIGNNIISNNYDGIELQRSSDNAITGNTITLNNWSGICLVKSSYNTINGNNISLNNDDGIYIYDSNINTIKGNTITSNNWTGICLSGSMLNTITGNNISLNNRLGISLKISYINLILRNNFLGNKRHAAFYGSKNIWMLNYWNKPRLLPKLIFGRRIGLFGLNPSLNIDWRPALKPYDIQI